MFQIKRDAASLNAFYYIVLFILQTTTANLFDVGIIFIQLPMRSEIARIVSSSPESRLSAYTWPRGLCHLNPIPFSYLSISRIKTSAGQWTRRSIFISDYTGTSCGRHIRLKYTRLAKKKERSNSWFFFKATLESIASEFRIILCAV